MTAPEPAYDGPRPKLGRLPVKSDTRALMFTKFASLAKLPPATNYWRKRKAFPLRSYGNMDFGDCTRAKQAVAAMRMERLETRRTISITDDEVIRVYREMSDRRYGGGDNGAFEIDALADWRNPATTFRDTKGRSLTIDAYLRLNPFNHEELKSALVTAGAHGIAICLNLPAMWSGVVPPMDWEVPVNHSLTGGWLPGSWGGHSMWCHDYDEIGLWVDHTWERQPQRITWAAAAAYLDEAHLVIDQWDYWRKKKPEVRRLLDFEAIRKQVNAVSSTKIAA